MTRHDGKPLDAKRQLLANKPLGFQAALAQARGDWQFYNQVFGFPSWSGEHICWRCNATQDTFKDFSPSASWRTNRISPCQFFQCQRAGGSLVSPLFGCPGFSVDKVTIGVLHCMDLGVTQEVLGNIMYEFLLHGDLPGSTIAKRLNSLWVMLQEWHKTSKSKCKLQGLTLEMIRKQGKPPKLRAKGAETRHLVPFGLDLATKMEDSHGGAHASLVKSMVEHLHAICEVMDGAWDLEVAKAHCHMFTMDYMKLNKEAQQANRNAWRIKPKFHLMVELFEYMASDLGNPRGFWEYRDEDFVGYIATLAIRRGGKNSLGASIDNVMTRYRGLASGCFGEAPMYKCK